MKTQESFWIFGHLGLGDAIACNALFRHYAELHKDKYVILPQWTHNISAVQWMLSDVPNIFFYPIETEQQLISCRNSLAPHERLCLGFYEMFQIENSNVAYYPRFNPILWDSEFYRQAGLDPELKWKGFKLPEFDKNKNTVPILGHDDVARGFGFNLNLIPTSTYDLRSYGSLKGSVEAMYRCEEIHCIDSSMLNLSDLMETPYCKRFVFHRYARKGLAPRLRKDWEVIE